MHFRSLLAPAFLTVLAAGHGRAAILAQQDFEGTPGALGYTTTGTAELNTGTVTNGTPNTSTWGVGGGTGLSFTSPVGVVTFAPINTLNLTDISLSLRLAALSLTSGNGLDAGDSFVLSISADGGATFQDQIQINGFSNATWSFASGTGEASRAYSTSAVTIFRPAAGGQRTTDGYSNLTLTGLPAVESLVIRLTATDDHDNEKWLVDNLVVQTVPEPAAALLGALGSLALLRRRR